MGAIPPIDPELVEGLAAMAPAPAPPSAPPADPMEQLRPFLVQRSREIAAAQKDANEQQRWADMANAFERGGAMVAGREPDKDAIARNDARAQRPVTQLKERQAADSAAMKDAGEMQGLQHTAQTMSWEQQKRDPKSAPSRAVQSLYRPILGSAADFLTAADAEAAHGAAGLDIQKLHNLATQRQAEAHLAEVHGANQEAARHHKALEDIAGAKAAKEKEIPPRQLERFAGIKATFNELTPYLADLEKSSSGPVVGRIAEHNPWRGADTSTAIAKEEALKVKLARALHGGVPTKTELDEAALYIPSIRDTPEQRTAKMDAAREILRGELQTLKQTYGEGGLKTSRLTLDDVKGLGAERPSAKPTKARVNLLDPHGGPINLPGEQVDAYLAAYPGAKRVGP